MKNIILTALLALGIGVVSPYASAACTTQSISVGETKNGSLSTDDCVDTSSSGNTYYYDKYQFTGTNGQQLYIQNSSSAIDADLLLLYPDDTYVYDDDSGGGTNARIPGSGYLTLPASGAYTVIASSALPNQTGAYTLSMLSGSGSSSTTQTITEFYNTNLKHYFLTADPNEASGIDNGAAGPGWVRTGLSFQAYPLASGAPAGALPVCRFYGTPGIGPNSHFYTVDSAECAGVKNDPGWFYEGIAYYAMLPSNGTCSTGFQPVYRAYNNRWMYNDSNHRFTTSQSAYQQTVSSNWVAEGVVMCVPGTSSGTTVPPLKTSLADYNTAADKVAKSNLGFLQANQKWEGANFSSLTASEVKTLANNFLSTGDQLVNDFKTLNTTATNITLGAAPSSFTEMVNIADVKPQHKLLALPLDVSSDAAGIVDISGVSPGLVIETGQVIQGAKDGVSSCNALFDSDPNAYKTCIDKVRQQQLLKAAGLGFSTVVGTGAAIIAGGAASAAAAPAAIVIGGAALAGYAVGKTVSWLWSKCAGTDGTSLKAYPLAVTGETCSMSSGQSEAGSKIPNTMTQGGTLVISIPGYVPVVIKNFTPPLDGNGLTIDFKPVPIDQAAPGTTITIDYNEVPVTASSCSEIQSASVTTEPLDPGPTQSVTVIARVFPTVANCAVSFSMHGTDGYSKSGTPTTDSTGKATFYIPGGEAGVHDDVTITVNGFTYSVTYTF